MISEKIFEKNLDNIKYQSDLFGNKRAALSMKDRIGFLPISIWRPNWEIVKRLKKVDFPTFGRPTMATILLIYKNLSLQR